MIRPQHISKSKFMVLVGILVFSVGLTAYLVINSFWGGGSPVVSPAPGANRSSSQIETEFANSFLNQEPYTLLRQYGPLPVRAGQKGRSDPFAALLYQSPTSTNADASTVNQQP